MRWLKALGPLAAAAVLAAPAASAWSTREDAGELLQGFLVAAGATDLYAPEFSFRVSGWNSSWGQSKILELAADGKVVKKGDTLVRFDFSGQDALRWIQDRIRRAEAEAAQGRLQGDQAVQALALEQRRKAIEAKLAGLDVERERAVSRRQADLYKIARQLAEFEVDAAAKRLSALRQAKAAERAHLEQTVRQAQEDLDRYQFYEARWRILAPHDGVVRHAFNPRERRKVQKGDGLGSGQRVLSVAPDGALAVKFFVPEHRVSQLAEGAAVTVTTVGSAEELRGVVKSIDFFPQEVGFLLENEELAHGREKAFQVRAELAALPEGLAAGTEVRVKVKAR